MTHQFNSLLSSCNAIQHVKIATHSDNHTLDLVITPTLSALDPTSVTILPYSPSDHFPVVFSFNHGKTNAVPKSSIKSFRRINSIDIVQFCNDLENSTLISRLLLISMLLYCSITALFLFCLISMHL